MNPLVIVCLCLSSYALVSCKPTNSDSPKINFSHNQLFDIQNDIALLQPLSLRQNQESAIFQQQALNVIRSGNSKQIDQVVQNLQQQIDQFNQQLRDLVLSSSEVDTIRRKMIRSYNLSMELAQQGAAKQPDTQKIKRLQQQLTKVQDEIHQLQDQALSKINHAKLAS